MYSGSLPWQEHEENREVALSVGFEGMVTHSFPKSKQAHFELRGGGVGEKLQGFLDHLSCRYEEWSLEVLLDPMSAESLESSRWAREPGGVFAPAREFSLAKF